MGNTRSFATGLALGTTAAFFFDNISGRRRRALARDQVVHYGKIGQRFLLRGARDFEHRAAGRLHEMKSRIGAGEVADPLLVERVRARVGRLVHHPKELQVVVEHGVVKLRGIVAPFEKAAVLEVARLVPGVRRVEDHLELGHKEERPSRLLWPRRTLKPATRLATAIGGMSLAAVVLYGLRSA